MKRSELEKMLAGELYDPRTSEIQAAQERARRWLAQINAPGVDPGALNALFAEGFGGFGAGAIVRPPFHCDYGFNIRLGAGVFLNFNCVILDVVGVEIGAGTQVGPGVQILAADHPRDPRARSEGLEFGRPIRIGCNVWIGAGALILPGVTIGDDAVVGAASVVTKDVAAGSVVFGNPARIRG